MRIFGIAIIVLFVHTTTAAQNIPIDYNAQAYIKAANITSDTEKNAINKFVRALKYYNVWDNIHALYIPTGGTAQAHKLNLKDPRDADDAFRLVYPNGAEHTREGTDWNGIDQAAFTFYSPTSTRLHLMVYQDEEDAEAYMFSGDINGITDLSSYTWSALYSNGFVGFANQGGAAIEPESERKGFFYGQRVANDSIQGYVNGVLKQTWYEPFNASYNTSIAQKIWINKNGADAGFLGTARYQVISIGNVMDSTTVQNYYKIIQAFLSELGIQYGEFLEWPTIPDDYATEYSPSYRWVKAADVAVDTAVDGVHLYNINDSLYLWGGWNGNWFPFDFNTGYASGDGGKTWDRIGQAPWNPRHSAAYGTDKNSNGYLIGSDGTPATTDEDRKQVWQTSDGRNWNLQTNNAAWSSSLRLHGLAIKGDTLYVAGGQFGDSISSGVNDTVWQSTDRGVTWEVINTNARHLGGALYNNFKYFSARKKFVAFCGAIYDDDPALRTFAEQVWTSDDCINWTREKNVPFGARQYSDMVEWDGRLWVWAGDRPAETGNGSLNLKDLWYMDKEGRWHEVGSIPVSKRHATGMAVDKKNNHLVLACGNLRTDVWYLEKLPTYQIYNRSDGELYLDSNCIVTVPDYLDSLKTISDGHAQLTQTPAPGTILNARCGDSISVHINADLGWENQSDEIELHVKDTTGPQLTWPLDTSVYVGQKCSLSVPDFVTGLAVRDCGPVVVRQSPEAGTVIDSISRQLNVVLTAEDDQHNISTHNVLINIKDTISPVINSVEDIISSTESGKCSAIIKLTANAYDHCDIAELIGTRSDSATLDAPFLVGTTVINWHAVDHYGNSTTAVQHVQVEDDEPPTVKTEPQLGFCEVAEGAYAIPPPRAADNCGIDSITYVVTGQTNRRGSGYDASGHFEVGENTITWTVKDLHGNASVSKTNVVISPSLKVSIPRVYALPQGASANTLYIGYGPSNLNLKANVDGSLPYTYQWSTGDTTQSINISAPTGIYNYTVTVANENCKDKASARITVMDIRCGSNLDKVSVCRFQHGQLTSICTNAEAVSQLLNDQSYLGICASNLEHISREISPEVITNKLQAAVMPNPTSGYFTVRIRSLSDAPITMKVFNSLGMVMEQRNNLLARSQVYFGERYSSGLYLMEVTQGTEKIIFKLIKN